jgi:hypothetical protein
MTKAISSLLDGRFTNLTDLVPACILLVTSLLATHPVYLWIKKAAAAGFLPVFLRASIRSDCYNFREKFANFIRFLTISTVYRPVLRPLQESVNRCREVLDSIDFALSSVRHEWAPFLEPLKRRVLLLDRLDLASKPTRRDCDDLEV